MDRIDLQELIAVIAARLTDAERRESTSQTIRRDGVADLAGFANARTVLPARDGDRGGDVTSVIAELLAAMPRTAVAIEPPRTLARRAGAAESEQSVPLARVARSLVTGLGVLSFVKGLFGGGSNSPSAAAPLPKFELPLPVRQEVAYSSQTGEYMAFDRPDAGGVRLRQTAAPAAVNVNVQAMDSRSFLDHSHEIARAVREAILNSNSLNDVVAEL
ncbi:MAG TPA: hypothetical protein VFL57_02660 [Bryobacteraceae bacterium]|nr:hypothetical protein [Bryobacteraceae bacterium]